MRTADHVARRRQVVDGVLQVVATEGLRAVTVAKVAGVAGVSVGLVQHYFPSKAALVIEAHQAVCLRIEGRVERTRERAERENQRIEHILGAAFAELLPLDEERHHEVGLALAFAGFVLEERDAMAALRRWDARLSSMVQTALANAQECGESTDELGPGERAEELVALVAGLAERSYRSGDPQRAQAAQRSMTRRLSELLPGPCSRSTA